MPSPKQTSSLYLIVIGMFLLIPASQQGHAATPGENANIERATLTRTALELQRDLLISQTTLLSRTDNDLAIYLTLNTVDTHEQGTLSISLDGQLVIQHSFDAQQLDQLSAGGIRTLRNIPLASGAHIINADFQTGNQQYSGSLAFEKSNARDNINITIANTSPQALDIHLEHERLKPQ